MIIFFLILFALAIGSFLNVVIYRSPRDISIVKPASFCPDCKKFIKFYDNIPIISYLILRGRCRFCKKPISLRYPLVELLTVVIFLLSYERFGFSVNMFLMIVFLLSMLLIAFIDWEFQIIPDWLTYPMIILGFLFNLEHFPRLSLLGILAGFGSLFLLRTIWLLIKKREVLGGGDLKMAAAFGSFLGYQKALLTIFLGAIIGLTVWLILVALRKRKTKEFIPFGTFLSIAAVFTFFFGDWLLYYYLSLFKGM